MVQEASSCSICCESYTKLFRKPVSCPSCHYDACMKCCETYLTSNPTSECMSCHSPWNREFIDSTFTAAWVKGAYTKHREGVLYDMERARLPDSQHLVRNYTTANELNKQIEAEKLEKVEIRRRLRQIEINRWNFSRRVQRIQESRFESDGLGNEGESQERRSFIRACPVDGCRGFLSAQLKCGICETYACGECFGIIGKERHGDHTCDPNDVETANFIKKESRPCPKCGIYISKVSGCDQMWCVQCRTAFSWRNGVVVTGTIHNPHYFEMLRNQSETGEIPRQPGDNPDECLEAITDPGRLTGDLHARLVVRSLRGGKVYDDIMKAQRHVCHLYRDTMAELRRQPTDNADLRMQFLMGTFDEPTFKRKLVLREKKLEKNAALLSCYEARVQMTIDLFQSYLNRGMEEQTLLERLAAVHDMMSSFLKNIQKRFKCSVEFGTRPSSLAEQTGESSGEAMKRQRVV